MTTLQEVQSHYDSSDDEDDEEKAILASSPTFGNSPRKPLEGSTTAASKASVGCIPSVTQDDGDEDAENSQEYSSETLEELKRKGKVKSGRRRTQPNIPGEARLICFAQLTL